MAEQQLSIRSTEARDLARRLAKHERRTLSEVVLQALQDRARLLKKPPKETDAAFWRRLAKESAEAGGPDIDLDAVIREGRAPHKPVEF
jgi:hypothetical protein